METRRNTSLTARSVVASTLLGTRPPELAARHLVRVGGLFGIAEGTVRVALSRMVAAGELVSVDGRYRLTGRLLERQARQEASRSPTDPDPSRRWSGEWDLRIVVGDARTPTDRAALRDAARALRLAERREGIWLRPDNLDPDRAPGAMAILAAQTEAFRVTPRDGPAALAAALWDLRGWMAEAQRLGAEMLPVVDRLADGDTAALAPGFVLSAAVLRHLLADPLLPVELVPEGWPGAELRAVYDRFDTAYRLQLTGWLRT